MMRLLALVFFLAASTAMAKDAAIPAMPYEVELWARASYDPAGQMTSLAFVDAASYPAAFLARVEAQLRQQPIEPKLADGVPATFDTSILVRVIISPKPGGADARIDDISQSPGILRPAARPCLNKLGRSLGGVGMVGVS